MYASVLVQYGVKSLDRTFTYRIPDELRNQIQVGMKVCVPFGRQVINGFVTSINHECELEDIKDIKSIVTKDLVLDSELLELGLYLQEKTLCSLVTAYQAMLPTSLKISNSKESYSLYKSYLTLNKDKITINKYIEDNKRSKKQIEILNHLLEFGDTLKSEFSYSSVKRLLELELIKERFEHVYRINKDNEMEKELALNNDQLNVYNEITNHLTESLVYLLHGVTGSGKTEVYMHLTKKVIENKKCVLMLVPEISLTTQIVKRFYNRFGKNVAIFHSNLSDGEKYDEYKKIMNGEVSIVVGTRSAIFTPLKNIGLIIIDEEHSSNYKQDNNPRYHALDMALFRSKYHACPILLGSATPSLESMARAKKGVYKLLELKNRVGKAQLPKTYIIDMEKEYKKRNMILSDTLKEAITKRLNNKEQVMLLLNRRGHSTIVSCQSCGFTYKCPHCDITLTYHKTNNHLRCHYCGYQTFLNEICPDCHESAIRNFGLGTQKLEEYVKELYPDAAVIRMDADTTSKKGSHEAIIKGIENLEYDIIIGTQMISKGLDFPKVTLVGIINADESLNIPDFRSGENTFSLLSQVSGRAGRSDLPGEVLIQSFNPENKTLLNVKNNDYLANYEYEMQIRKSLKYPPYYYLISIKITSKEYELARDEATKVASFIRKYKDMNTIVLGPTTAQMFRLNNIYRFQILIKYRFDDELIKKIKELDLEYALVKDVNLEIDINPIRV